MEVNLYILCSLLFLAGMGAGNLRGLFDFIISLTSRNVEREAYKEIQEDEQNLDEILKEKVKDKTFFLNRMIHPAKNKEPELNAGEGFYKDD